MKKQQGKLYILSGPSGVGKTVIAQHLLKQLPKLKRVITYTSRKIRKGEKNNRDYHFTTAQRFNNLIDKNFFLEWAEVHNNLYGTPKPDVEKQLQKGDDVLLVIDVQGALIIKEEKPDAILIFIKPDNMKHLKTRIKNRKQKMLEGDLQTRLANAKKELSIAKKKYNYIVTNNENRIEKTQKDISQIIQTP